ncbi:NUDIX hydrolase [Sorangium cellulosum]|uniref:NAD(+) diphosphatase n=1 Tax=Sorangium cellulosum TaxID=56 RepID=A0A4V0NDR4_SORCE|nr:NUDIX hydrolase [Sorangium cellulosum]
MTPVRSSRFRPGLGPPRGALVETAWFAFHGDELLVRIAAPGDRFDIPVAADLAALGVRVARDQPLGELDGRPCRSAELAPGSPAPEGYAYVSLRRLHGRIDPELFDVSGTAYQVQYWDRTHQYCAACGAALDAGQDERVKRCARCASSYFPRITPATIVLVEDGPRVLMTRQARFPAGMYGLVAGFVEPGETLEACVAREVREETGIDVADVAYFGSQPWPFPHQIMVGFTARHAGGELRVDTRELEDARWFHRDALPLLPPPLSIARQLIDAWRARPPR